MVVGRLERVQRRVDHKVKVARDELRGVKREKDFLEVEQVRAHVPQQPHQHTQTKILI